MTRVYDGLAMPAPGSSAGARHFLTTLLARNAPPAALAIAGRDAAPLATTVETAFESADRKRGLLGRRSLAQGSALIIAPCNAIHTFRMQFAIDVIFAARDGRVLKIRRALAPSRVTAAAGAFATIEMAAGEADRHGLQVGDVLEVRPVNDGAPGLQTRGHRGV